MSSLSPLKIVTALTNNAADVAAIFWAFMLFITEIDELPSWLVSLVAFLHVGLDLQRFHVVA